MKPLFTAIQCLMALTALPASAQPARPMPILELARHLELAPAQREQLHQLLDGRKTVLETKHFAASRARRALQTACGDPDTTAAQLKALCAGEAGAHQEEILEDHALLKAALALLTPEQLQKYRKAQADLPLIREVMAGGPGRRGPEGRPCHPGQEKVGPGHREPRDLPGGPGQEGPHGPDRP